MERTALLLASTYDRVAVARLLVTMGADPTRSTTATTPRGWSPASPAAWRCSRPCCRPTPTSTIRNRFGGISVIPASERGHVDYVRRVVQTDIDVNHVNDLGWTALLEAVILGDGSAPYQEIVRILLDAGADPDIADGDGVTALEHATSTGQHAVADLRAHSRSLRSWLLRAARTTSAPRAPYAGIRVRRGPHRPGLPAGRHQRRRRLARGRSGSGRRRRRRARPHAGRRSRGLAARGRARRSADRGGGGRDEPPGGRRAEPGRRARRGASARWCGQLSGDGGRRPAGPAVGPAGRPRPGHPGRRPRRPPRHRGPSSPRRATTTAPPGSRTTGWSPCSAR